MKSSDVYDRYNELCQGDKFICSEPELNDFRLYGLILGSKDKYVLRDLPKKEIEVISNQDYKLNLDFSKLLNVDLTGCKTNKVYYMSKKTYDKYKEENLIISRGGREYYRLFTNEEWLVILL